MPFEELEHTADVKMRICAPCFQDLVCESGFALARVLYGEYPAEEGGLSIPISADGRDADELCVNFLSELLFVMETEYLVPQRFSLDCEEKRVTGFVFGTAFDSAKHSGGIEVKGISYSGLSLTKTNTGYELIIIFDI